MAKSPILAALALLALAACAPSQKHQRFLAGTDGVAPAVFAHFHARQDHSERAP